MNNFKLLFNVVLLYLLGSNSVFANEYAFDLHDFSGINSFTLISADGLSATVIEDQNGLNILSTRFEAENYSVFSFDYDFNSIIWAGAPSDSFTFELIDWDSYNGLYALESEMSASGSLELDLTQWSDVTEFVLNFYITSGDEGLYDGVVVDDSRLTIANLTLSSVPLPPGIYMFLLGILGLALRKKL